MPSRRMIVIALIPGLLSLIGLTGCGSTEDPDIVCTTAMVADLAKNIGGKDVTVVALMKPGVDPHLFQATTTDTATLGSGKLIFASGKGLESASLRKALDGIGERKKNVFEVTRDLPESELLMEGERIDPHLWHNVDLWKQCGKVVLEEMCKWKPELASKFKANYEDYAKRLTALHEEAKKKIQEIPPDQRVLVTAHDAFSYFGKAYGLEVHAIQGISTEDEPSVKKINDLVDFLVKHKIRAVFIESTISQKTIKSLQEGSASRGHKVTIGGELYSDSMGHEGIEATYEGMIRHNVDTIVKALR